jgi:hypothetical protein
MPKSCGLRDVGMVREESTQAAVSVTPGGSVEAIDDVCSLPLAA